MLDMGLQWHLASAPKSADFRKIGLAPRRANFDEFGRKLGCPILRSNFLARQIGLFCSVQFFGPRPSPIFHRADFRNYKGIEEEKIGLENRPENWTAEKLARRKIGLPKKLARKIGLPSFRVNSENWPGAGPGQFFENRLLLARGRFPNGGRFSGQWPLSGRWPNLR